MEGNVTSNVLYEILLPENETAYWCDWDFENKNNKKKVIDRWYLIDLNRR